MNLHRSMRADPTACMHALHIAVDVAAVAAAADVPRSRAKAGV